MRKRTVLTAGLLALIFGFLLGTIFPPETLPWGVSSPRKEGNLSQPAAIFNNSSASDESSKSAASDQAGAGSGQPAFNSRDNFPLLNAACFVVRAIQQRDYAALASYVDPERGLTFTAFSTVDPEVDLTFTREEVAGFAQNTTSYPWTSVSASGEIVSMTPDQFFSSYIFNVDYTQTNLIGIDRVNISGNALENVAEAYPDCRFVDFTYPGQDGQDWSALKLVFTPAENQWQLVGLIHSQWTV